MSLTVTPGASNADSYATVAEANAYFFSRGITTWTGTTTEKENALRRAADYLENQYRDRWIGYRSTEDQSLAWPRTEFEGLVDSDGYYIAHDTVPTKLKHAQIEAALLVITSVDLQPALERGGQIKRSVKKVGPIEKDITYMDGAPVTSRYTAIEGLLRGLVKSTPGASTGVSSVVRA